VVQSALANEVSTLRAGSADLLAADIGGTHARIGLVRAKSGSAPLEVLAYRKYVCAEWPSLPAILEDFLKCEARQPVRHCAIAIAGYPVDDRVINENLAWPVSGHELRQALQFSDVALVNDFAALAHALRNIDISEGVALTRPGNPSASGARVVIGPGTGLGAAVLVPHTPRPLVLATEAGQVALAPRTALEREILGVLATGDRHVPVELALSGPGIVNLYNAVAILRGVAPTLTSPAAITDAAISGNAPIARIALEVFCGLLGSYVGDLAMLFNAGGGVFLAGGVLPHMQDFLLRSTFVERFLDKGGMRTVLERVPVRLLEHGRLGVLGAAGWYVDRGDGK
jgi:glucokinase